MSIQSSDYRGRPVVAFTLDLSHYTVARSERIRQIEFWTTAGAQDIRRVGLIYDAAAREPDELRQPTSQPLRSGPKPVDWEQVPLLLWDGDAAESTGEA